jgi:hypothetical protein
MFCSSAALNRVKGLGSTCSLQAPGDAPAAGLRFVNVVLNIGASAGTARSYLLVAIYTYLVPGAPRIISERPTLAELVIALA